MEAECPDWLFEKIKDSALLKALNEPASADLRINKNDRNRLLKDCRGEGAVFCADTLFADKAFVPVNGLILTIALHYKEGEIEVQDEASQLAAILADVQPAHKAIDYCCGAGGKSLTMSYLMKNKGKIQVHDINWGAARSRQKIVQSV